MQLRIRLCLVAVALIATVGTLVGPLAPPLTTERSALAAGGFTPDDPEYEPPDCGTTAEAPRCPLIFVPGYAGTRLNATLGPYEGEVWPAPGFLKGVPEDVHLTYLKLPNGFLHLVLPEEIGTIIGFTGVSLPLGIWRTGKEVYDPTFDHLKDGGTHNSVEYEGYTQWGHGTDPDLFLFPYDWRLGARDAVGGNTTTGDDPMSLAAFIEWVLDQQDNPQMNRVDILAHSLGGLVTLGALMDSEHIKDGISLRHSDGTHKVRRVMMIATPLQGVADALGSLEFQYPCFTSPGGDVEGCLADVETVQEVITTFPSTYQGLPTQDLENAQGGAFVGFGERPVPAGGELIILPPVDQAYHQWSNLIEQNRNGELLDYAEDYHRQKDEWISFRTQANLGVQIARMYGTGIPTISRFNLVYEMRCKEQFDCKVVKGQEVDRPEAGDSFVLSASATWGPTALLGPVVEFANTSHMKIIQEEVPVVTAICYFSVPDDGNLAQACGNEFEPLNPQGFRAESSASAPASAEDRDLATGVEILTLQTAGPIVGLVADGLGSTVGYDESTGEIVQQESARYFLVGDTQEFIFDGAGSYSAELRVLESDEPLEIRLLVETDGVATGQAIFWPVAPAGAKLRLGFASGPDLSALQLEIDLDDDGTVDETMSPDAWVSGATAGETDPPTADASVQVNGPDDATLTLSADDGTGGSGIAKIYYKVVGVDTEPQVYSGPIDFTSGAYVLFRAVDNAGNRSPIREVNVLDGVPADVTDAIQIDAQPVTITTTAPGQNAEVTFSGTTGQEISLVVSNVTIGDAACCGSAVAILDPSDEQIASAGLTTKGQVLSATLPADGTYTIVVNPLDDETGSATLALANAADVTGTIQIDGSPVTVTTTVAGQEAVLSFDGLTGQQISLDLSSVSFGADPCDMPYSPLDDPCGSTVTLLNPDGTELYSLANVGTSGGFIDALTLPADGTYEIRIDPAGTNTGSVTLGLFEASEVTANLEIDGDPLQLGISKPGQNAVISFTGASPQTVDLTMSNVSLGASNCCGAVVSIERPDGFTLGTPLYVGTDGDSLRVELPVDGTYTIRVDPLDANTGSITLTLSEVLPVTGAIQIDSQPVNITVTEPQQRAELTFNNTTAGQAVSIEITESTIGELEQSGARISLVGPSGTLVAGPVDVGTSGGFIDQTVLTSTGAHTIRIDPILGYTGSITVKLHDATDLIGSVSISDPDFTMTTLRPGQNIKLSYTGGSQAEELSLALTDVTASDEARCGILLSASRQSNGQHVLLPICAGTDGGFIDRLTYFHSGDTYTILIDPQGTATGSITFTPADGANVGDSTDSLSVGGSAQTVQLDHVGTRALLSFGGIEGQEIRVDLTNVSITNSFVRVVAAGGVTVAEGQYVSASGAVLVTEPLPADDTYWVVVDPVNEEIGSIDVAVSLLDVTDVTGSLTIDGPSTTVQIIDPGQNAEITFSGTAEQELTLDLTNVGIGSSACCGSRVAVLNPDGSTLVFPTDFGTAGATLDLPALASTGTYTIVIDPYSGNIGDVTLTLTEDGGSGPPPDVTDTIQIDGPGVTVTTTEAEQNAQVTFTGTVDQVVQLDLSNVSIGSSASTGVQVSITNPDASTLVAATDFGTDGLTLDPVTLPANGTYEILIDPQGSETGGVTLTLTDETEVSESIQIDGSPVTVTTTTAGQSAHLSFTGTTGQMVSLELTGVSIGTSPCCSAQVTILNPDATVLVGPVDAGADGGFIDAVELPADGAYEIVLDPQGSDTGSATLTLHDVSEVTGSLTIDGASVPLTLGNPGQNGRVSFSGTLGQEVVLEVSLVTIGTSPTTGSSITLLNPDQTLLVGPTAVGTDGLTTATLTLPATGTYTIVVDPDGTNTGSASFSVMTVAAQGPTINSVSNNGPIYEGASATITVTATPGSGGTPLSYAFDCDNNGSYEVGPQAGSSAGCNFDDDGIYTVGVRVTDPASGEDTDTTIVSVTNVAPAIISIDDNAPVPYGFPATITVTASDPAGVDDTLSYRFDCDDNGAYEVGPQSGTSTACSFDGQGTFRVWVEVSDGDGGITEAPALVVLPTYLCRSNVTGAISYSTTASCNSGYALVTVPPASGTVTLCASIYTGGLRYSFSTCTGSEMTFVLPDQGPINICVSPYTSLARHVFSPAQCAAPSFVRKIGHPAPAGS